MNLFAGSYNNLDSLYPNRKKAYFNFSGKLEKIEINHIPPISVTNGIDNSLATSIPMVKRDHRIIKSTISKSHRAIQRKLIEQKGFDGYMEAFKMDVKDIQKKFGNKYDKHIEEAKKYIENKKDLIKTQLKFAENYPDLVQKTTKRKSLFEKLKLTKKVKQKNLQVLKNYFSDVISNSQSSTSMSSNSLNFTQTIKGQLSDEISSDFQPSFQRTIDEYTDEYIFDQIKSAGRNAVHKYTGRISDSMDTYLSYDGQGSSDSSDWADEIFDENTCNFFRKVVDDWDNRRILPKLKNRFNDSFEEFREEINKLLLEGENTFENSQAKYFHRLEKLEWEDSSGEIDSGKELEFKVIYALIPVFVNKADNEEEPDHEWEKDPIYKGMQEKMTQACQETVLNYTQTDIMRQIDSWRKKELEDIRDNEFSNFVRDFNRIMNNE